MVFNPIIDLMKLNAKRLMQNKLKWELESELINFFFTEKENSFLPLRKANQQNTRNS